MAKAMADKGTFVLTFGRFNPPTKGHEVVFDAIETAGKKHNTRNLGIFTSQSTQDAKNPLSYRDKVKFIRKAHPQVRVYENRSIKTLFDAVGWVFDQDYSKVVIVLGSDRIPAFKGSMEKFVKKEFPGKKVVFEQAGENRSEGSKGVAGVSGTKVRKAVKDNDYKAFKEMISDSMSAAQKKQLFQMLRKRSKALSESVAFAMDIPNTFSQQVILKNPSWNDILKMMKGGSGKVRGFFNDQDIYCWDAAHFVHSQAVSYLRMAAKNFRIFFKFGLGSSRTIEAITTFSTSPGLAWFEPEYQNMDPDIQTFNKHAKKLGWKFSSNPGATLKYFIEQDEMILPQKSHITIHQLDNTTFDAKIDTGNNSYCAMHADDIRVSGNKEMVTFTINGKTYTAKVAEFVTVASSMGHQQTRVVVEFDVHFANQHYTDVRFSLTDRSNKEFPILLGTQFLSQTNVLVKPIAENVNRYQSLESMVRNQLLEAKIYPQTSIALFDLVDRMSSNNWYLYGDGMLEARWLYFPKSKFHVFWNAGTKIHVEIIRDIMREYPDEIKEETTIYAGYATRHALDKGAIVLSLDHAYKIDGSIRAAYPPQLSESELAKIFKSAFGLPPKSMYLRKTTGGRSSGGGRGFTEEYAKVGFTDQNRAKALEAYKKV